MPALPLRLLAAAMVAVAIVPVHMVAVARHRRARGIRWGFWL